MGTPRVSLVYAVLALLLHAASAQERAVPHTNGNSEVAISDAQVAGEIATLLVHISYQFDVPTRNTSALVAGGHTAWPTSRTAERHRERHDIERDRRRWGEQRRRLEGGAGSTAVEHMGEFRRVLVLAGAATPVAIRQIQLMNAGRRLTRTYYVALLCACGL
jgi:hypothetical protein